MNTPRIVALLLALAALACSDTAASERTVVFASASLTAPFEDLVEAFERNHPDHPVRLNTAGTPQLVLQAREGARVDIFASADAASLEPLLLQHDDRFEPVEFARGSMAIVVAAGNPRGIDSVIDLGRSDLLVSLCGPAVPAGRYAREVLARASVEVRSVSDEPSVRALVSKVALGELDAGLVYATDLRTAGDRVEGVAIADEWNVTARYPLAILTRGPRAERASAFVEFVRSEAGGAILTAHGFQLP